MKYKQRPIYRNLFWTVTIILQVEKLENLFACLRNPKCSLSQSFAKACDTDFADISSVYAWASP